MSPTLIKTENTLFPYAELNGPQGDLLLRREAADDLIKRLAEANGVTPNEMKKDLSTGIEIEFQYAQPERK